MRGRKTSESPAQGHSPTPAKRIPVLDVCLKCAPLTQELGDCRWANAMTQCGKAAGGCSSRPAFFKEKIFDFLQYTRMMLPPEECQCGKAAGGCSSRPAFFKEKIFDFLHYTMSFQLEQPPVEDSSVKTAAFLLWSSNLRRKSIFLIPAVHEQTRQRGSRGRLHDMMGVGYRDAAPYMSCLCNRLLLQDFTFY